MNDNNKIREFLAHLRKFLPEKTIYMAFSVLPEDMFDIEDYISIPSFESDEEIRKFIENNGFEDPDNIIKFFMDQYMEKLHSMLEEFFDELENRDENAICFTDNLNYNWLYAE